MKHLLHSSLMTLCAALLLAGCEGETVTGSSSALVLPGSQFTVTERLNSGTQMTARGTVKNNGTKTWSPVWIVEGEFYSDSTFSLKLGGTTRRFTYSLEKGSATFWELRFTSKDFDLGDYPEFAVRNLRVIQE